MEEKCSYCNGKGKVPNKYQIPESYKTRTELVDCPRCEGTGLNPKAKRSICHKCKKTFLYHREAAFIPRYCPDCKEKHARSHMIDNYAPPNVEKMCRGLDGIPCANLVYYNASWKYIPSLCADCKEEVQARRKLGAKFYTNDLIPARWKTSISYLSVDKKHGKIVFKAQGTNGANFIVRWNADGVPVWDDEGLPINHELRHRDPR